MSQNRISKEVKMGSFIILMGASAAYAALLLLVFGVPIFIGTNATTTNRGFSSFLAISTIIMVICIRTGYALQMFVGTIILAICCVIGRGITANENKRCENDYRDPAG